MLTKIFDHPYPVTRSKKEIILSALGIAATVYLFLVIFQPFGTYNYIHKFKYILLAPYSIITFLLFALADLLSKRNFRNWNIGREILKQMLTLFACTVCSYWYNIRLITPADFSINGIVYMYMYTSAVGLPVCTIFLLAKYILLKKTIIADAVYPEAVAIPVVSPDNIRLQATAGNDLFEISKNDFLFACAEGNYCNISYVDKDILCKYLIRIPLKMLEEQINDKRMARCHRSFIVNLDKIVKAKGNAQGYKLLLEGTTETVPVSRKYLSLALPFTQ